MALTTIAWRDEEVSRVVLGAVQLGMKYGIANTQGQPDRAEAARIVETALQGGVRHIDTAQSYGESEAVLGEALRALGAVHEVRVCSKLDVQMDPHDVPALEGAIERSFERLGVPQLWCMMLHRASWLEHWDAGLGALLRKYRDTGRIRHLGVSLSSPAEASRCLEHPDMEILQVACNAWDRRMIALDIFGRARTLGKLCCVRSIYLQGLLTLPPEVVAKRLPAAGKASERWQDVCTRFGTSPLSLAMRFVLGLNTPLAVGAETQAQIAETLALASLAPLNTNEIEMIGDSLDAVLNEQILEPWRWPSQ